MAEVELDIQVESNIDRLSETAIRRFLGDALSDTVKDSEEFLRAIVPRDTGELAAHVGYKAAEEGDGGLLRAAVGIPPIDRARGLTPALKDLIAPGEQDPSDYPLFRDRGTGIFGPAHAPIHARRAEVMKFDGAEGHPIFRSEVKGSEGDHFMLATYAFSKIALTAHIHEMGERVRGLATGIPNL